MKWNTVRNGLPKLVQPTAPSIPLPVCNPIYSHCTLPSCHLYPKHPNLTLEWERNTLSPYLLDFSLPLSLTMSGVSG